MGRQLLITTVVGNAVSLSVLLSLTLPIVLEPSKLYPGEVQNEPESYLSKGLHPQTLPLP